MQNEKKTHCQVFFYIFITLSLFYPWFGSVKKKSGLLIPSKKAAGHAWSSSFLWTFSHWQIKHTNVTAVYPNDSSTYLRPELRGWGWWDPWSSMTKLMGLTTSLGLVKHKQKAQFIFSESSHAKCWKGCSNLLLWSGARGTEIWANPTWGHQFLSHLNRFFPLLSFTGNRLNH